MQRIVDDPPATPTPIELANGYKYKLDALRGAVRGLTNTDSFAARRLSQALDAALDLPDCFEKAVIIERIGDVIDTLTKLNKLAQPPQ